MYSDFHHNNREEDFNFLRNHYSILIFWFYSDFHHQKSYFINDQHFIRKSVLKPSGPGDLSERILETTKSISFVVKGSSRQSKLAEAWMSVLRSKYICWNSEMRSLLLYGFQRRSALFMWLVCSISLLSVREVINFFHVTNCRICMKKFYASVSTSYPFNCTSLLPIDSLLLEKLDQFGDKNIFEVPLR